MDLKQLQQDLLEGLKAGDGERRVVAEELDAVEAEIASMAGKPRPKSNCATPRSEISRIMAEANEGGLLDPGKLMK